MTKRAYPFAAARIFNTPLLVHPVKGEVIARALATDPKLILLDEPTAGMNPKETEEAKELIFRIRDMGLAVVVIEHDMRFIFTLCDRVLCLVRGALLVEGSPATVQSDPRVIEAYIGSSHDDDEPAEEGEQHA